MASALGLVGKIILKQRIKIKWTVLNEIEVVFILLSGNLTVFEKNPLSRRKSNTWKWVLSTCSCMLLKNKSLSRNVRSEMSTKCANYIWVH